MAATFSDEHKLLIQPDADGPLSSLYGQYYARNMNGLWAYSGPMIACIENAEVSTDTAITGGKNFANDTFYGIRNRSVIRTRTFVPHGYDQISYAIVGVKAQAADALLTVSLNSSPPYGEYGTEKRIWSEEIELTDMASARYTGTLTNAFERQLDGMCYLSFSLGEPGGGEEVRLERLQMWLEYSGA